MDPRLSGVLLILGILFPGLTAELLWLGYDLQEAVSAAGTVAIVAAEVVRRLLGGGPGPSTGPLRELRA